MSENMLDDNIPADDDTNELWTLPWDMPAVIDRADNFTSHAHCVTSAATVGRIFPSERPNPKGWPL